MSSGTGRGRGWLNLSNNSDAPRPGDIPSCNINPLTSINLETMEPPVSMVYTELIKILNEIDITSTDRLLKQKLTSVKVYLEQECNTEDEIRKIYKALYNNSLRDKEIASKLVLLVTSPFFKSIAIHTCLLRRVFLYNLQRHYEGNLQTSNPELFHNYVFIIGEYFRQYHVDGKPPLFLVAPLLSGLEWLLRNRTVKDLMLFTSQIFLNGAALKSVKSDQLSDLGITIRTVLVSDTLENESKLWLLLALDLFNVRFGVLPPEIYSFYEDQLGSAVMVNFQKTHDALCIQTVHSSKMLDSYQSNVSVLQISTSPTGSILEVPTTKINNIVSNDLQSYANEKTGRPILGVGARYNKDNSDDNWLNNKNNSGRSSLSRKKVSKPKPSKGWEHDDRCENNYM